METILNRSWYAPDATTPSQQALQRALRRVVLNTMLDRAGDARADADVRQVVAYHLDALRQRLQGMAPTPAVANQALREAALREIAMYFDGDDDPAKRTRYPVIALPWP
jgi:hypothetical protein